MTNYDLEEAGLLKWQLFLSLIVIVSTIISILLTYNEILKHLNNKPIYNKKKEKDILISNRIIEIILALGFLLINCQDKKTKTKYNKSLNFANIQIGISSVALISAIIVLYIAFKDTDVSIENPEV